MSEFPDGTTSPHQLHISELLGRLLDHDILVSRSRKDQTCRIEAQRRLVSEHEYSEDQREALERFVSGGSLDELHDADMSVAVDVMRRPPHQLTQKFVDSEERTHGIQWIEQTPWEFSCIWLKKRRPAELTNASILRYAFSSSRSIKEDESELTSSTAVAIAELHDDGATDELLRRIWDHSPAAAVDIGLPKSCFKKI